MSEISVADEARALGELVDLVVERITAPVEGMHRAIADRSLRWTGSTGEPARRMFDATITSLYDAIRLAGSAVGATTGLVASAREEVFLDTPLGRKIQAVVNATWGDELEQRSSEMRIRMGLRSPEGTSIGVTDLDPAPTSRVVVLVHGLGRTEGCWLTRGEDRGLWDRLHANPSLTPVMIRYNTGRHISDNGVELASILEDLYESWPTPIESLALVGHSMGGLVIRSACHVGKAADHHWVNALDNVVTVGTPHLGAPLEKTANVVSWSLRVARESRPLADFLDARSVGIKDLRFGAIVEEDWSDTDAALLQHDGPADVPLLPGVDHHFVAAVVTETPAHPVGALFGDLMVRVASGTGRGRRRRIEATSVRVLGGRRHFDLLHDSEVQDQILAWLDVN